MCVQAAENLCIIRGVKIAGSEQQDMGYLPLHWQSSTTNATYYSVIFQICETQMVIELISNTSHKLSSRGDSITKSKYDRMYMQGKAPHQYYGDWFTNDVNGDKPIVQLAKISHFTSDVERESAWFTQVLNATLIYKYDSATVKLRVFGFENLGISSIAQVHLVERPAAATAGEYKVSNFEATMNQAHAFGGKSKNKMGQQQQSLQSLVSSVYAFTMFEAFQRTDDAISCPSIYHSDAYC